MESENIGESVILDILATGIIVECASTINVDLSVALETTHRKPHFKANTRASAIGRIRPCIMYQ
jgi:hypothetical protein